LSASGPSFWRSKTYLTALVYIAVWAFGYGPLQFLPAHLAKRGLSIGDIGWVISAGSVGSIAILPLAGYLTRRALRTTLIASIVGYGAFIMLLSVPDWSTSALMAINFFIFGAGWLVFTSGMTLVADASPEGERTKGVAIAWAILNLFRNVVGTATAEWTIHRLGYDRVVVGFASVEIILGALLGVVLALEGAATRATRGEDTTIPWRSPALISVVGIGFVGCMLYWVVQDFLTSFAQSRHIEPLSVYFIGYSVVVTGGRLFGGDVLSRHGNARVATVSLVLMALSSGALSLVYGPTALGVLGFFVGFGHCLLMPSLMGLLFKQISALAYATALGNLLLGLGRLASGAVFGRVGDAYGYSGMFLVAACIGAVTAIVTLWRGPHIDRLTPTSQYQGS
jgi:MFS family permease